MTDFVSFYVIDGVIINNPKYSKLKSGFLYYMVPKDFGKDANRMSQLVSDTLSVANKVSSSIFQVLE